VSETTILKRSQSGLSNPIRRAHSRGVSRRGFFLRPRSTRISEPSGCAGRMVPAIREARARVSSIGITAPGTEFFRPETKPKFRPVSPARDQISKTVRQTGRANAASSHKVSVTRDSGNCVVGPGGLELPTRPLWRDAPALGTPEWDIPPRAHLAISCRLLKRVEDYACDVVNAVDRPPWGGWCLFLPLKGNQVPSVECRFEQTLQPPLGC
jgi:hypothetical protein